MVTVKVPATSANMGSGFDSVGVALQLYNTVSAEEIDNGLNIEVLDESIKYIPLNERNLVYRAMMATFERIGYKPKGLHIVQKNEVPVTRGMGSSSACIVGGIMAANEIGKGNMTRQDIINLASYLEGHPDNVTPAVTGFLAVTPTTDNPDVRPAFLRDVDVRYGLGLTGVLTSTIPVAITVIVHVSV